MKAESHADRKHIEQLMRQKGARRTVEQRDVQSPYQPGQQETLRAQPLPAGAGAAKPEPSPPGRPVTETEMDRIDFLVRRDEEEQARAWVERTLKLYREAIASSGHAAGAAYRPMFEESIRVYEDWLHARSSP